ncbi:MAG: hypothetical protein GJ676_09615 [Rhodobacteraceae bacterium]|nr:hypothetical protein [Paracoccaceae bacterium]
MSGRVVETAQTPSVPARRDDLLVSVCFSDLPPGDAAAPALKSVAAFLEANYRYWEILIVFAASNHPIADASRFGVSNLRQLTARAGTSAYRARVIGAAEAIGDVVVLTTPAEVGALDLVSMIDTAFSEATIVSGRRGKATLFDPALRAVGAAGGFRVSTADMQTVAYPRTLLNVLLAHPDRELALRFAPRDAALPVAVLQGQEEVQARSIRDLGRRLNLMQKLMVAVAPRVLSGIALLSGLVFISAVLYAFYALWVWLFLDNVQPGWFTTSMVLSLTAAFLATAIFGLSVGMQKVIDLLSPDSDHGILDEHSTVDLFSEVMQELNVELDSASGASGQIPPEIERTR